MTNVNNKNVINIFVILIFVICENRFKISVPLKISIRSGSF